MHSQTLHKRLFILWLHRHRLHMHELLKRSVLILYYIIIEICDVSNNLQLLLNRKWLWVKGRNITLKRENILLLNLLVMVKNIKEIGYKMTSGECFENKWFCMKYVRKCLSKLTFDPWICYISQFANNLQTEKYNKYIKL